MPKSVLSPDPTTSPAVPLIESRIYLIRGEKVLLDADLAHLYEVPTKRLNEAVRRNRERFPEDFMFQLAPEEYDSLFLRSQIATSNAEADENRGGRTSKTRRLSIDLPESRTDKKMPAEVTNFIKRRAAELD